MASTICNILGITSAVLRCNHRGSDQIVTHFEANEVETPPFPDSENARNRTFMCFCVNERVSANIEAKPNPTPHLFLDKLTLPDS